MRYIPQHVVCWSKSWLLLLDRHLSFRNLLDYLPDSDLGLRLSVHLLRKISLAVVVHLRLLIHLLLVILIGTLVHVRVVRLLLRSLVASITSSSGLRNNHRRILLLSLLSECNLVRNQDSVRDVNKCGSTTYQNNHKYFWCEENRYD